MGAKVKVRHELDIEFGLAVPTIKKQLEAQGLEAPKDIRLECQVAADCTMNLLMSGLMTKDEVEAIRARVEVKLKKFATPIPMTDPQ